MLKILMGQHNKISDVECENASFLRCRTRQLFYITRVGRHPIIRSTSDIVTLLYQSGMQRFDGGVCISMQAQFSH
jgi:hypothetical protein